MKPAPIKYLLFFLLLSNIIPQSKTDPTPITDIGDGFRSEEISLDPIYSASYWNDAFSGQEKETKAQELVNWSIEQMQNQDFDEDKKTGQSFMNLTGISNISEAISYFGSLGIKYDSSANGKGNAPFRIVKAKDLEGNSVEQLAILTGDNPLDRSNYTFFNSATGEKLQIGQEIDPDQPLSINGVGYIHSDVDGKNKFTFIQDLAKFDGEGNLIAMMPYDLRNPPNKSFLDLTSPNDTTVTDEDPDLIGDKYGVVLATSHPEKGKDFEFNFVSNKITGGIYIDKVVSLDTLNITPDGKYYTVNKKTLVNLLERDTLTNLGWPNGKVYEHLLKKDSVYQKITVDLNTSVEEDKPLENNFKVYQNYPNPFNPTTTIKYTIPKASQVKLSIYNSLGEEIRELLNEFQSPGEYELKFSAEDLPSGVYFYQLHSGSNILTRKMILLK